MHEKKSSASFLLHTKQRSRALLGEEDSGDEDSGEDDGGEDENGPNDDAAEPGEGTVGALPEDGMSMGREGALVVAMDRPYEVEGEESAAAAVGGAEDGSGDVGTEERAETGAGVTMGTVNGAEAEGDNALETAVAVAEDSDDCASAAVRALVPLAEAEAAPSPKADAPSRACFSR